MTPSARRLRSVAATLLPLALAFDRLAAQDDGIDWHTDLEAARETARATKKPLLAAFRCEP